MEVDKHKDASQPPCLDPAALQILLVDRDSTSRAKLSGLLKECSHQVTSCGSSSEAVEMLNALKGAEQVSFDLIMKTHCPDQGSNACRLLRRVGSEPLLQGIPIIVVSGTEDRDAMVSCLQLGAADYMMKPARLPELRNLWARVYWWRRASYHQQLGLGPGTLPTSSLPSQISGSSLETRCEGQVKDRATEEKSGEGSAPNETQANGSREIGNKDPGSKSGSKEGNAEWSRNQGKSGSVRGNSGEGVGISAFKGCPVSAMPTAAECSPGGLQPEKRPSSDPSSQATTTALDVRGFSGPLSVAGEPPDSSGPVRFNPQRLAPATSGFRAYISTDKRKRSSELPEEAVPTRGSSGPELNHGASAAKMRWTMSRLGSGGQELGLDMGQHPCGGRAGPRSNAGEVPGAPQGLALKRQPSTPTAEACGGPLPSQTTYPFYPFGIMPNYMTMSNLWAQLSSQPHESDLVQFFIQLAQQAQGHAASQCASFAQGNQSQPQTHQQQQQQMAVHSQLMMQYNMLMQQYGLPLNAMARQQSESLDHVSEAMPAPSSQLPARPAARHACNDQSQARHWETGGQPRQASGWRTSGPLEQSLPSSGRQMDVAGHCTGTSSHATAQVGSDGTLIEPSQQERRAQALHKYKMKRKNLCFTKRIRYESRKQLAQARPRIKGQFVRVQSGEMADTANTLDALDKIDPGQANEKEMQPLQFAEITVGNKLLRCPDGDDSLKLATAPMEEETEEEDCYGDFDSAKPLTVAGA